MYLLHTYHPLFPTHICTFNPTVLIFYTNYFFATFVFLSLKFLFTFILRIRIFWKICFFESFVYCICIFWFEFQIKKMKKKTNKHKGKNNLPPQILHLHIDSTCYLAAGFRVHYQSLLFSRPTQSICFKGDAPTLIFKRKNSLSLLTNLSSQKQNHQSNPLPV